MTSIMRSGRLILYCLICLATIFSLASGVSVAATAPATDWEMNYGSDGGNGANDDTGMSVWQTSDNGFIIAGLTSKLGQTNDARIALLKTDWQGNQMWITYSDEGTDPRFVRQTSDGGYVVVGSKGGNLFVLKTDEKGEKVWAKVYPRPSSRSVVGKGIFQTSDGGYIVAGDAYDNDPKIKWDIYVTKLDSSGNIQWEKFYYSSIGTDASHPGSVDNCFAIWPASDGGYIIGGSCQLPNVTYPAVLVKIDANGNQQWYKALTELKGRYDANYGQIQQTRDGGYIWASSNSKLHLIKTDSNGNHQWNSTFDHYGIIYSVQQTWDDGYVVTGGQTNSQEILVIRTDSRGKLLWEKTLYGLGIGRGQSVLQIGNGSYVVAGYTLVKTGPKDFYLAQLDKDFTPVPNAQFISPRDAYVMDAGKLYHLTIVMTNNGTMPWTFQDGTILAPSSDSEDMAYFSMINYTIPIGTVVRPGQSINVNFTYTAPAMNGTYHPEVRMFWTGHGYFGEPARFTFYVVNGTPDTRTPTATPPAGATAKPTSKPTANPTAAGTATAPPEPTTGGPKSGLPCLPSMVLPLLVVSIVTFGVYRHRK